MFHDEGLVVSLNVGVIGAPELGAVAIRMAFLAGSDRAYVFTAPIAYEVRDVIDAAFKARVHMDPPKVDKVALELLRGKPTMRRSDVEELDPSTVLRDVYGDEFPDGLKVAVVCVDGTPSTFVLGNLAMRALRELLADNIKTGGFNRPHQAVTN